MKAKTAAPMTRSPLALARTAFSVAQQALPPYSSKYSRQDFTQHQLVAILVLRQFFRTDLRSMIEWLSDFHELRETLELKKIPHYSTLSYAERRLLKKTPSFFSRLSSLSGRIRGGADRRAPRGHRRCHGTGESSCQPLLRLAPGTETPPPSSLAEVDARLSPAKPSCCRGPMSAWVPRRTRRSLPRP